MKYELVNNSSFKTKTLHRIIRFASRGFGPYLTKSVTIVVSNTYEYEAPNGTIQKESTKWGGAAWDDNFIFVCVAPDMVYPCFPQSEWTPKTQYIDGIMIKDRKEMFLGILVHEIGHIVQANLKLPIITSNIISIDEEAQNDIVSMVVLNKWRRKLAAEREKRKSLTKSKS